MTNYNQKFSHILKSIIWLCVCLALCSCNADKKRVIEITENLISTETESNKYDTALSDLYPLENEYIYEADSDNSDGIVNIISGGYTSYYQQGNRLYLTLSKDTENGTGVPTLAYIDTLTGDKHYMCPDPLCPHTANSGCRYINFQEIVFSSNSDTDIYATQFGALNGYVKFLIYHVDLANNQIKNINFKNPYESDYDMNQKNLYFMSGDVLYFSDSYTDQDTDKNGELVIDERDYLVLYNTTTQESEIIPKTSMDTSQELLYCMDNRIYLADYTNKCLLSTDMKFEDAKEILSWEDGFSIADFYYDENTKEFFILLCPAVLKNKASMDVDTTKYSSKLYKIDQNLEITEISMPSTLVNDIQITNTYIYYTVFDPIFYGYTRTGQPTIDETGGKIYRTKRADISSQELVFDGKEEVIFNGMFYLNGNNIYLDYYSTVLSEGGTYFYRVGPVIRYNIDNKTVCLIDLD